MANGQDMTFEQIDQQVQGADLSQLQQRSRGLAPADAAGSLQQLCAIWRVVGPIIRALAQTPFIPGKWKEALRVFADLLDRICQGASG